ncbi:MAG: hypothetical protein WCC57_11985 [Paracoccaceae bacterium]
MKKAFANGLSLAAAVVRQNARAAVIEICLLLGISLAVVIGAGFLVAAAYLALWPRVGAAGSAAIIGAALLVLAIGGGLLYRSLQRRHPPLPTPLAAPIADLLTVSFPDAPPTPEIPQPVALGQMAAFIAGFVIARRARIR